MAKPEIEERESEIIFHHLREAGASHEKKVRTTVAVPRVPKPNAPGGLRDVAGYAAWELGAIAAAEDERLFQTED